MAGDWIKVEHVTCDKPEVFRLAEALDIDPDAVIGKLLRVWVWADQQSRDGHVVGVTKKLIDRLANVTGFGEALVSVGWMTDGSDGLRFSNFSRHNGETAKKRALAKNRKQNERSKSHADVTEESRKERDNGVTREEIEKSKSNTPPLPPPSGRGKRKNGVRISADWKPSDEDIAWTLDAAPELSAQDVSRIADSFRDYWTAKSGQGATKLDWSATWRNWVRRHLENANGKGGRSGAAGGKGAAGRNEALDSYLDAKIAQGIT